MKGLKKKRNVPWEKLLLLCLLAGLSGCGSRDAGFAALSELEEEAGVSEPLENASEESQEQSDASQTESREAGGRKSRKKQAARRKSGKTGPSRSSPASGSGGKPGLSAASDFDPEDLTTAAKPEEIYVDVCGAVARPGVYRLKAGSRVFQAVELAGGLLPEAAGAYVNQAVALTDGQQIYIPTRTEAADLPKPGSGSGKAGEKEASARGNAGTVEEGKINLNTADLTALMTLTGIGESKAKAILAYREEHGRFSSIEEICNVQGIKEGTFGRIRDQISIE